MLSLYGMDKYGTTIYTISGAKSAKVIVWELHWQYPHALQQR